MGERKEGRRKNSPERSKQANESHTERLQDIAMIQNRLGEAVDIFT